MQTNESKPLVHSAYSTLRSMKKGEMQTFPLNKWNAVRSSASVFKRRFGVVFKVRKTNRRKKNIGVITVFRIQ